MSDKDKLRELADQLICHPVSRSIDETEEAGEAIKCLLGELKSLQAENDRMASELARPVSGDVSTLLAERSKLIWENERLKEGRSKCVEWLNEAADDIAAWGAYASAYIQERHNLDRDVLVFRDRAAAMKGTP